MTSIPIALRDPITFHHLYHHLPIPVIAVAVEPKDQGRPGKMGVALFKNKSAQEDPTFTVPHRPRISGQNIIAVIGGELPLEMQRRTA